MYPALKVATLKSGQKGVSMTPFSTFYNYIKMLNVAAVKYGNDHNATGRQNKICFNGGMGRSYWSNSNLVELVIPVTWLNSPIINPSQLYTSQRFAFDFRVVEDFRSPERVSELSLSIHLREVFLTLKSRVCWRWLPFYPQDALLGSFLVVPVRAQCRVPGSGMKLGQEASSCHPTNPEPFYRQGRRRV